MDQYQYVRILVLLLTHGVEWRAGGQRNLEWKIESDNGGSYVADGSERKGRWGVGVMNGPHGCMSVGCSPQHVQKRYGARGVDNGLCGGVVRGRESCLLCDMEKADAP